MSQQDFLQGQLLAAMPSLSEGCFRESVVLMCAHSEDHAMGLVINKPISNLTFQDVLKQVGIEPAKTIRDCPVLFGGPVETKRGLVLHSPDYESAETLKITPEVSLTATRQILSDLNENSLAAPNSAILCMGHAGWSAGQLEHELMQNAWIHAPADRDLIFDLALERIWPETLARLGVGREMLSGAWADMRDPDGPVN